MNEIILRIIDGVEELHNLGFVHRDLKPDNVMMNLNPLEVRVIDFDRCYLDTTMSFVCVRGTPLYFPEDVEWRNGSKKWDVWAIAAIILEADMPLKAFKNVSIVEESTKLAEDHIK